MRTLLHLRCCLWAGLSLALAGCGDDSASTTDDGRPYQPGATTVIGQDETPKEYDTVSGAGCLKDADDKCVDLSKQCAPDDKVDVVVDKKGVVVSVICYPTGSGPVSSSNDKPPTGRTFSNNEVLVLDEDNDGNDLEGDVDIDSNNVTVWGDSPATAVIGGNVTISKNNGIVRGVRIKGNVTINGNNAAVLLSVIEGDVTINGNNNVLASCDVYGKVTFTGKNGGVVSNRVAGSIDAGGQTCSDNLTLLDPDGDKSFDDGEVGEPISCGK